MKELHTSCEVKIIERKVLFFGIYNIGEVEFFSQFWKEFITTLQSTQVSKILIDLSHLKDIQFDHLKWFMFNGLPKMKMLMFKMNC